MHFQQHKLFRMRIFFHLCPGGQHHGGFVEVCGVPGCPPRATSASPCPICNLHCCPELGSPEPSATLGKNLQETPFPAPKPSLRMEERLRSSRQIWEPLGVMFAQDKSLSFSQILPLFQLQGEKKNQSGKTGACLTLFPLSQAKAKPKQP